ncbi:MAG: ATP synthase F1 subunit epsilon [Lachnospiraceae bacterium]|nr:ATP synthase F1 subunit epsilon [Lachnospiraceae bacterium]
MNAFATQIISSDGMFYFGRLKNMIIPAVDGELGILPGHEEMIIALTEGILRYQDTKDVWHKAAIGRGTIQFANNRCTIVVDTAEKPEDIDVHRAEDAKARAEEKLQHKLSDREYRLLQMSLARALTRLKLLDKD